MYLEYKKTTYLKWPWLKLCVKSIISKNPIPLDFPVQCAWNLFFLLKKLSFLWNLTSSCRGKRTLWAVIKRTLSQNKFFHKDKSEQAGSYEKRQEASNNVAIAWFFAKYITRQHLTFAIILCLTLSTSNAVRAHFNNHFVVHTKLPFILSPQFCGHRIIIQSESISQKRAL